MANDSAGARPAAGFEEALQQLVEVVNVLEEGAVGLEESLRQFERGMLLLRQCHEVLTQTEQRISQLTGFDSDGNPVERPFDAEATITQRKESAGRRKRGIQNGSQRDEGSDPSSPRLFS